MEAIRLKGTKDTPDVLFDADNHHLNMSGRSIPEDAASFYQPILRWLDEYSEQKIPKTVVEFKMEYFNTASSKIILEIFTKLETIHENGNEILVRWYYPEDDEDMMEAGELYSELVEIPFEYIGYEVENSPEDDDLF